MRYVSIEARKGHVSARSDRGQVASDGRGMYPGPLCGRTVSQCLRQRATSTFACTSVSNTHSVPKLIRDILSKAGPGLCYADSLG